MTQINTSKPREILVAGALSLVGAEAVVGLVEAFSYRPNLKDAYASEVALRAGFVGSFLSAFHYWASALFLVLTFALLLEMVWNEGYRDLRRYYGAFGLAVVAFVFQITGNALPADRHGVQTAVVEAGIASKAPVVGPFIQSQMLRGTEFSDATLALWWTGHAYILTVFAILGCLLLAKGLKAPKWAFYFAPALILVMALLVHAPLGDMATSADFGAYNARVSWYTWPLHGMMSLFLGLSPSLGWIGSILVPTVVAAALVGLPWIRARLSQHGIRLAALVVGVFFLVVAAVKGGPIASLTGNRDPAKEAVSTAPTTASTDPKVLALVKTGRDLFNSPGPGCSDCHGTNGAKGTGGPNLTKDYLKHSDVAWYVGLIRNPKSVNPSATMPAFPDLPQDQVTAIATFLSQPPS